jgi:hypothetical protein
MGRTFRRPVLPAGAAILTERKRRLYREPKIVLAGMTRRLEAAWSEAGRALGVQVYAAAELRVDPHFLLAVLNSKLLSFVYRTRFQAKRLAGGFFSLNKRQLAQLPIPTVDREEPRERLHHDELSRAARRLSAPDCPAGEREALDRRIDEIVYTLFRLTRDEIQTDRGGLRGGLVTSSKKRSTSARWKSEYVRKCLLRRPALITIRAAASSLR